MRTVFFFTLYILLFLPLAAQADIYRWQSSDGSWHFSDNLSKVPSRYRDQVKREALPEKAEENPSPIQEETAVQNPENPDALGEAKAEGKEEVAAVEKEEAVEEKAKEPDSGTKTYKIEYTEAEDSLELDVTFNEDKTFTFVLDTGASFVTLSRKSAEKLGYDPEEILPRVYMSTANGLVSANLIRLASVQVGDAVVHDVTAIVHGGEELGIDGLLGLSFLNEFDWSNDTMNEVLILKEFKNKPEDEVYGGHNEKWWRKKFEVAKKKIKRTEDYIEELKAMNMIVLYKRKRRDKEVKIQEANRDFHREELHILDRKANRYEVPRYWR